MLFPVRGGNGKKPLENSLEGIISNALAEEEVRENVQGEGNSYAVGFVPDFTYTNDFLLSILKPHQQDSETVNSLVRMLKASFEKNQPRELASVGAVHTLEEIESPVIEFFQAHTLEQISAFAETAPEVGKTYLTLKQVEYITGKSQATIIRAAARGLIIKELAGYDADSVRNYVATKGSRKPERGDRVMIEDEKEVAAWRKTAQEKVSEYRKKGAQYLSIAQVQEILGLASPSYVYALIKKEELPSEQEESGHKRLIIQLDNTARFIDRFWILIAAGVIFGLCGLIGAVSEKEKTT